MHEVSPTALADWNTEEQFRLFLESVTDYAIFLLDPNGGVARWNAGAEHLFGYTEREIIGQSFARFFVPEEQAQDIPAKELQTAVATGRASDDRWSQRKDGSRFWASGITTALRDEHGTLLGYAKVVRDRTEYRRASEELRRSEERFRALMEESPLSTQIFAPDGRPLRANRAWEELWGTRLEDIPEYNVLHDPQLEAKGIMPYIRRGFAGEVVAIPPVFYDPHETLPGRSRHRDAGRWVRAFSYPIKDRDGAIVEIVLVHEDITHQKRQEEQRARLAARIQAQQKWLESVLNLAPTPILLIEPGSARVKFANKSADAMAGGTFPRDVPAEAHPTVYHCTDAQGQPLKAEQMPGVRAARGERLEGCEMDWHTPGGKRSLIVYADTLPAMHGHPATVVLVFHDISAVKEVTAELRAADRRKDEFLAMLAHELRNPLAPIANAIAVLRLPKLESNRLDWARDVIDRQVRHLSRLVDDLLDVSRITRGKVRLRKEPVELRSIIARAVETSKPLIASRRHELTVTLAEEPARLEADPLRLAQVFGNLLNNAAKYTEEGGQIWLTVERQPDEVLVHVRDTGIGISPEMLPRVFDLFTQADKSLDRAQGGLGIGLTLVQRLVELHGGKVEAHSEGLGQGSEFVVRLPLTPVRSSSSAAPAAGNGAKTSTTGRRVLIVEDNADAAETLGLLLETMGQQVRVVHDGTAAVEAARSFHPEIVLLDIGLPGMNGYEVARHLREQHDLQQPLLVALTGYGQEEDRARARDAGFDLHMVKPVEPELLKSLLQRPSVSHVLTSPAINPAT
jgi:PAS domain S-box-containing protein